MKELSHVPEGICTHIVEKRQKACVQLKGSAKLQVW